MNQLSEVMSTDVVKFFVGCVRRFYLKFIFRVRAWLSDSISTDFHYRKALTLLMFFKRSYPAVYVHECQYNSVYSIQRAELFLRFTVASWSERKVSLYPFHNSSLWLISLTSLYTATIICSSVSRAQWDGWRYGVRRFQALIYEGHDGGWRGREYFCWGALRNLWETNRYLDVRLQPGGRNKIESAPWWTSELHWDDELRTSCSALEKHWLSVFYHLLPVVQW